MCPVALKRGGRYEVGQPVEPETGKTVMFEVLNWRRQVENIQISVKGVCMCMCSCVYVCTYACVSVYVCMYVCMSPTQVSSGRTQRVYNITKSFVNVCSLINKN
jgi:hypothetical protein